MFRFSFQKWWDEPRICNSIAFGQIAGFLSPGPFHLKNGLFVRYDNNDYLYDFKNNLLKKIKLDKQLQIENRLFQTMNGYYSLRIVPYSF